MRHLNLALQGGGSHGAFTWGVLDALLDDGRVAIEGLSGTSAGAVNAVALASGWATAEHAGRDAREGAREALRRLWDQIAAWGTLGAWQRSMVALLWGGLPAELGPAQYMQNALRGLVSPYQSNPLDINPLRDLLAAQVDFGAIAGHARLKVFVSATHVNTGKAVVFSGDRLNVDAVLASACLPMLFKAVEIDGQAYWDGGYSVNPALSPLISQCAAADLMLVQINPLLRSEPPRAPGDILDRINELTFNASLLTQMRAIDFINELVAHGALAPPHAKTVRVHRIDGGAKMQRFPVSSRASPDPEMIRQLHELGREVAREWLAQHFHALGQHSTIDIRRDYLDDTRLALPPAPGARPRGFRPWLARLLGRQTTPG
jgi:NTE family protein